MRQAAAVRTYTDLEESDSCLGARDLLLRRGKAWNGADGRALLEWIPIHGPCVDAGATGCRSDPSGLNCRSCTTIGSSQAPSGLPGCRYLTVTVAVKISSSRDATAARRSVQTGWIEPSMAAMPS